MQRTELHLAQIKRGLIERQSSLWGYNKPVQEIKLSVWGPKGDYVDSFSPSVSLLPLEAYSVSILGFPGALVVKNCCQCRRHKRPEFNPWVRKSPWRRSWKPTPVFFPGESHGQRSLAGYHPWGRKNKT